MKEEILFLKTENSTLFKRAKEASSELFYIKVIKLLTNCLKGISKLCYQIHSAQEAKSNDFIQVSTLVKAITTIVIPEGAKK